MIHRPSGMSAFEFVILSSLRAAQLKRGCLPRVEGIHKTSVMAQIEVAAGKVKRLLPTTDTVKAPISAKTTGLEEVEVAAVA